MSSPTPLYCAKSLYQYARNSSATNPVSSYMFIQLRNEICIHTIPLYFHKSLIILFCSCLISVWNYEMYQNIFFSQLRITEVISVKVNSCCVISRTPMRLTCEHRFDCYSPTSTERRWLSIAPCPALRRQRTTPSKAWSRSLPE